MKSNPLLWPHQPTSDGAAELSKKVFEILGRISASQNDLLNGSPRITGIENTHTAIMAIISQECAKARIAEAKHCLHYEHFETPMKSMRSRNTAFKKYAVKYFNSKMKQRLQYRLAQLTAPPVAPKERE